jgi:hypothetical protein
VKGKPVLKPGRPLPYFGDDVSEQVEFLRNVVASARASVDGAVALLRQLCAAAVEAAPPDGLVKIGQCLVRIGEELHTGKDG